MNQHPATAFRGLRSKYFAIANKHGYDKALYILEKDREKIGDARSYSGLLCELIFMKEKYSTLQLTPTLDCGDHCDFTGIFNNSIARFDVTSSLEYKNIDDYSPFQQQGHPYYIVLIDPISKKIDKIIDINFPFCPICDGRILNILLEEEDFTRHGTPSPTQKLIRICSNNYEHIELLNSYNYHLPSLADEIDDIQSDCFMSENSIESKINAFISHHGTDNSLFFSKLSGYKVHACGGNFYTAIGIDGDGYWETKFYWQADIIGKLLPSAFGAVIDQIY